MSTTVKSSAKKRVSESEASKPEKLKRDAIEDDFDAALSDDIKGIVSTLQLIREKAQKDGQKKNEETISRCILDIDVQGARSVRASSLEAIFIFICPPSFEELEKRLRDRGTETEEQIQKRLRNARAELQQGQSPGLFEHILVNDDLETCYESLKKVLGLDGIAGTTPKPMPKFVDLPVDRSVSKMDKKIRINCRSAELENASEQLAKGQMICFVMTFLESHLLEFVKHIDSKNNSEPLCTAIGKGFGIQKDNFVEGSDGK
ncbi:hypothetical protein CsSME_00052899 [Camellia sinensis var. sinensis]